ncbi:hypothetical protein LZ31DRAFT_590880 [Colletotrichum somersetense]|nr:hypothetical protein LZ31DRAFT_590880 [Colletotrichum somersetense]
MQTLDMDDGRLNSVADESDFDLGSHAPSGTRVDKDRMEMINVYDDAQDSRFLIKHIALSNFIRVVTVYEDGTDAGKPSLTTALRQWQPRAVEMIGNFLRGLQRGAILGDGMGLGKHSLQSLLS